MLSLSLTRRNASTLALAAGLVCLAPPAARAAIASAAGLVAEAAPLVVAAAALTWAVRFYAPAWMRRTSLPAWAAALAGCGCGTLPGALSLPAAAFTWYAFGPTVAAARFIVGFGAALIWRRSGTAHQDEPLGRLAALVPYALAGGLASEGLRALPAALVGSASAGFGVGLLVGLLSPCTLGAIAVATALYRAAPWISAGILATAGFMRPPTGGAGDVLCADARVCYGALAGSGLALCVLGGAGVIHPRLSLAVLAAGVAGLAVVWRRPGRRASLLAPLLVATAIVLGSPAPRYGPAAAVATDAFVGEPVRFTGVVERRAGTTLLVRFAITCCRSDASPVVLRLDRDAPLPTGAWATVDGVFRSSPRGLVVHAFRLRPAVQPRDPFIYR